jgi:hypothetical protein
MNTVCGVALAMAIAVAGVSAHHSFAAEYDSNKPVTVSGTVTSVEWTNPHIHFWVDVKSADGSVAHWRFEGYPPNMLVRQGWKKDATLKAGDAITVTGWQARLEPKLGAAREVTFADGKKMTAGPPAGTGGQ